MLEIKEQSASTVSSSDTLKSHATINVMSSCDKCTNSNICKFVEDYNRCKDTLTMNDNISEVVQMNVSCKYYKENVPSVKPKRPTISINGREAVESIGHINIKHRELSNND